MPEIPLSFIPHGVDVRARDQEKPSPYGPGLHAVSVGSVLFDESFFTSAADQFPEVRSTLSVQEGQAMRSLARMTRGDSFEGGRLAGRWPPAFFCFHCSKSTYFRCLRQS
jgi:hypothetical protein